MDSITQKRMFRQIEAFEEHNTYTSTVFLEHMLKFFLLKLNVFKLTTIVNLQKNSFLTKRTNLVCLKKT